MGFSRLAGQILKGAAGAGLKQDIGDIPGAVVDPIKDAINRGVNQARQIPGAGYVENRIIDGAVDNVQYGVNDIFQNLKKTDDVIRGGIDAAKQGFDAARNPLQTAGKAVDAGQSGISDIFDYTRHRVMGAPGQVVDFGEGAAHFGRAAGKWWEGEEAAVSAMLNDFGFKTALGAVLQTLSVVEIPLDGMKENYGEAFYQIALTKGKSNQFGTTMDVAMFGLTRIPAINAMGIDDAALAEFVANNPQMWPAIEAAYEEGGGRAVWELVIGQKDKKTRIFLELALDPLTYAMGGGVAAKAIKGTRTVGEMSKARKAAYYGAQAVGGVDTAQDMMFVGPLKVANKLTRGVVPRSAGAIGREIGRVPGVSATGDWIADLFKPSDRQLAENQNAFKDGMLVKTLGAGVGAPGGIDKLRDRAFKQLTSELTKRQRSMPLYAQESRQLQDWLANEWQPWVEDIVAGGNPGAMPTPPTMTLLKVDQDDLDRIAAMVTNQEIPTDPTLPYFGSPSNLGELQQFADDLSGQGDLDTLYERLLGQNAMPIGDDFTPDPTIDRGRFVGPDEQRPDPNKWIGEGRTIEDEDAARKADVFTPGQLGRSTDEVDGFESGVADLQALIGDSASGKRVLEMLPLRQLKPIQAYFDALKKGIEPKELPRIYLQNKGAKYEKVDGQWIPIVSSTNIQPLTQREVEDAIKLGAQRIRDNRAAPKSNVIPEAPGQRNPTNVVGRKIKVENFVRGVHAGTWKSLNEADQNKVRAYAQKVSESYSANPITPSTPGTPGFIEDFNSMMDHVTKQARQFRLQNKYGGRVAKSQVVDDGMDIPDVDMPGDPFDVPTSSRPGIRYEPSQDIFATNAELIVNPTNLTQSANAGLARQFNDRFQGLRNMHAKAVATGQITENQGTGFKFGNTTVWDLPTKRDWRDPASDLKLIDRQLESLADYVVANGIKSVAIPKLGTGLGRLRWEDVRGLIEKHFDGIPNVEVRVLGEGSSTVIDMPADPFDAPAMPDEELVAEAPTSVTRAGNVVVVAGSRPQYWPDQNAARQQVEDYVNSLPEGTTVISGMAPGVDRWAYDAAKRRGLPVEEMPADWSRGRGAGMDRNRAMADLAKSRGGRVKVFQAGNSPGSKNMEAYSRQIGVLDDGSPFAAVDSPPAEIIPENIPEPDDVPYSNAVSQNVDTAINESRDKAFINQWGLLSPEDKAKVQAWYRAQIVAVKGPTPKVPSDLKTLDSTERGPFFRNLLELADEARENLNMSLTRLFPDEPPDLGDALDRLPEQLNRYNSQSALWKVYSDELADWHRAADERIKGGVPVEEIESSFPLPEPPKGLPSGEVDYAWLRRRENLTPKIVGQGGGTYLDEWDRLFEDIDHSVPAQTFMKSGMDVPDDYVGAWSLEPFIDDTISAGDDSALNQLWREYPAESLLVRHRIAERTIQYFEAKFNRVAHVDRAILDAQLAESMTKAYARLGVDARGYWKKRGIEEFGKTSNEGILQEIIFARKLDDVKDQIKTLRERGLLRESGGTTQGEEAAYLRWLEVMRLQKSLRKPPKLGRPLDASYIEFGEGETGIRLKRTKGEKGNTWTPLNADGSPMTGPDGKVLTYTKKTEAMRKIYEAPPAELTSSDFAFMDTEEIEEWIAKIDADADPVAADTVDGLWNQLETRSDRTLEIPEWRKSVHESFPSDEPNKAWMTGLNSRQETMAKALGRQRSLETPYIRTNRLPFNAIIGRRLLDTMEPAKAHDLLDSIMLAHDNLAHRGYDLPDMLVFQTSDSTGSTNRIMAMSGSETGSTLYVNVDNVDYITSWKQKNDEATARIFEEDPNAPTGSRWFSSDDPNHGFYHEYMHLWHLRRSQNYMGHPGLETNPTKNQDWSKVQWAFPSGKVDVGRDIGAEVSVRASLNVFEFIAEVSSAHIAGKRYPKWVMDAYHAFDGPPLYPVNGPGITKSPMAVLNPSPIARNIQDIALGGAAPKPTPADTHITAQLLGGRGTDVDFSKATSGELSWWLGGQYNVNRSLSAQPRATNMALRLYQKTGADNVVKLMHEHAFVDNETALWLLEEAPANGNITRTNADVIFQAIASTYNPIEARNRAMNVLAIRQPDPTGWRKKVLPFVKTFERATNMMREAMMMNIAKGMAGMLTDYSSNTYVPLISGNADAVTQIADFRGVINTAEVMLGHKLFKPGEKVSGPVHELVEIASDAYGIAPEVGVINMVNRDLISGFADDGAWEQTVDDLFRRGPNWLDKKLKGKTIVDEDGDILPRPDLVKKDNKALRIAKRSTNTVSSPLIRALRHAGDVHPRATLWWVRFNSELMPKQDEFFELLERRAANLGKSPATAQRWKNEILAVRPGGTFHADDVKKITGDTALAQDWAGKLNSANKAAAKEVDRVYFSYKMTNADEHLRKFFLFHYWQTRAVAFHAGTTLRNPGLLSTYLKTWEAFSRENEEAGLDDRERSFWRVISFSAQDVLLDPMAIMLPMTMFREWGNTDGQNDTFIDKALNRSGLFLNPIWQAGLTMMGMSTKRSDALGLGTGSLRALVIRNLNLLRNQGLLPGFDPGLTPDPVGIMEQRLLEFVNGGMQWVPLSGDMADIDWRASARDDMNEIILHQAELEYGPYGSMTPEQQLEIWDAQAALIMENYDNERAMRAIRAYSQVEAVERGGRMFIPGNLNFIYMPEEHRDALSRAGYDTMREGGVPNEAQVSGMMSSEQANAGSVEAVYTTGQANVLENIGNRDDEFNPYGTREHIYDTYYDIMFGRYKGKTLTMGGIPFPGERVNALSEEDRKELADSWLDEDPNRRKAFEQVGAVRSDYISGAPELQQYRAYKDWLEEMGDPRLARMNLRRTMENYARAESEERQNLRSNGVTGDELEKRLDSWVLSLEAYYAVLGVKRDLRDEAPVGTPTLTGIPQSTVPGGSPGTGSPDVAGNSGGSSKLHKEVAAYFDGTGPETLEVNRYLRWQAKMQRLASGRDVSVDAYLAATKQVTAVTSGK